MQNPKSKISSSCSKTIFCFWMLCFVFPNFDSAQGVFSLVQQKPFEGIGKIDDAGSGCTLVARYNKTDEQVMRVISSEEANDPNRTIPEPETWYKAEYNYKNSKGKLLFPFWFEEADLFIGGVALARHNNKYGYVSYKGDTLSGFKYWEGSRCRSGKIFTKSDYKGNWELTDLKGNVVDSVITEGKYMRFAGNYLCVGDYDRTWLLDTNFNPMFGKKYKNVFPYNELLFIVEDNNNLNGIVSQKDSVILPIEYSQISSNYFGIGRKTRKKNKLPEFNAGKWFFGERKGQTGIENYYGYGDFSFASKKRDKYILDSTGKIICGPYSKIDSKEYGFRVEANSKEGAIDKNGKIIVPVEYNSVIYKKELKKFKCGIFLKGGKILESLVDLNGKIIIPPDGYFGEFVNGKTVVRKKKEEYKSVYGIIDTSGKWLVDCSYDLIECSEEKVNGKFVYRFRKDENSGYWDENLKELFSGFKILGDFRDGLAYFSKGGKKYGFLNEKGEIIIEEIYDDAGIFKKGRANVRKGNRQFVIDMKGNILEEVKEK